MSKKRHKPAAIVAKLRHADILVSRGQPVADAIRSIGVTDYAHFPVFRRLQPGLNPALSSSMTRTPSGGAIL
ncbi:hypothetical protein [Bosea sp. BIWAKO-01]|uniref:hypothetical protein n=1 Tax=Bosea sp. BIWAKO-01 TaxID=506668 RepID=UPI00086F5EC4|nr:hypothetical protein BIWAKO_06838 [Bosea sp. BIWAKO-01]